MLDIDEEQLRKKHKDSCNKKLKTSSLNKLSKEVDIEDLFSLEEKYNCTIAHNKNFIKMKIGSLYSDALIKTRKEYLFETLREKCEESFLNMTFADFFRNEFLGSEEFKDLLVKNAHDPPYLKILIDDAYDYLRYFEEESSNKTNSQN